MSKTAMMEQIYSVPELWKQVGMDIRSKSEQMAQEILEGNIKQIMLTGCGDSLGAAMAAKQMFLDYTDFPVQVETAVDLSRHYPIDRLLGDTLVVAVSNSGNVSRVIELAKRVSEKGGTILAVTSRPESELAKNAKYVFNMAIPKFHRSGPGMRSYSVALLSLYELALSLGMLTGAADTMRVDQLRKEMDSIPTLIEASLDRWDQQGRALAQKLIPSINYEFLGSGADYSTAWFGYAKELEVAAKPASALSTEDWMHMNYFVRDVHGTTTFMFVNGTSPTKSRTDEVLQIIGKMERPIVCVSAKGTKITEAEQLSIVETPHVNHDVFQPLIQYLPVSMILSHIGVLLDEVDFRGTVEHWTACIEFASIADSAIELIE